MVISLVFSLRVNSFHSALVSERMLGDSKATSDHVLLIGLDDKNVGPSWNDLMVGYWTNFQERESSAQLSREEVEEDEEVELEEEVEGEGKEDEGDEEEIYEEEDEEKGDKKESEGDEEGSKLSGDDFRPFILPKI